MLLILCGQAFAQSEPNDPITYDTTITEKAMGEGPFTWQVRITRQKTDNSPRPAIFSMPGAGEVGTSLANLVAYGPHYWLQNGWDGSVKLGNGTHYPIIITVEQPTNNMRPWHLKAVVETLLNTFPIKRNSVHVCGLSQGSYEWGELIGFAASAGDETAMSEIRSWVDLEGVSPGDNFLGYDPPFPQAYKTWVSKYGGRFFGLEGTNDSRNIWQLSQAMNSAAPNSAYFSYQNIGGGVHCCWNSMYDPKVTNWTCVGTPGNPNVVPSTNPASTMGSYFYDAATGSNIFQWMLRQGDTTLVTGGASAPSTPTVSAGSDQTLQLPASTISLSGSATAASGHTIASTVWSWTSGPSTYTISSPNSLSTSVTGLVAGTYVFTLTVTDDAGQTSTSTTTVTVAALVPPTVSAGSAVSVTLPTSSVSLSGTASANGGASISSTQWTVTGPNTPVIASPGSLSTGVSGLVQGNYVFTLTVKDNNGSTSTSTVNVTVNAASTTPPPTTGPPILVATGEYQVFFVDQNKHLYAVGTNLRTLGTNETGTPGAILPVQIPSNLTVVSAASALHGGAAIDNNGNVWGWGDNSQGQVGIGTVTATEVMVPTQLATDVNGNSFGNVASLCAFFSGNVGQGWYAIKNDGTLWVWGQTLGGMQGDGTAGTANLTRPKQIVMPGGRLVKQVSAGNHAIVLCTDGTVWTFGGSGEVAQNLGYAVSGTSYYTPTQLTSLSNIVQVSGGGSFNYALKADGTLYGWGYYGNYMGGTSAVNSPIATPTDLTTRLNLPHPIKTIVSNMVCTHVILTDGTLWGWGDNAQGTIGIGKELDYSTTTYPYAWDWNPAELLQLTPVQVTSRTDFVGVFATWPFVLFTYAETADGQLYSWGRNKGGVLGNGVVACSSDVAASYPNSWDVVTATPVNPLTLTKTTSVPSPYCLSHATTTPCNECSLGVSPVANAGAATTITLPTNSAILDGSASSSPDGSALTYTWSLQSGPSSYTISSASSAKTSVTGLVQGSYIFLLTVKNSSGYSSTATVTVTVKPAAVVTPVANAGSAVTITLPTNSASLDGSASSSPDGSALTYAWSLQSGPSAYTITSPSTAKTGVTGLVQGTYTFQLTVKNTSGNSATATVTVTVKAAPVVTPVANAGSDLTITLPTSSVSLDGSASSSPDGSSLTYTWSYVSGPAGSTITSPGAAATTVTGLVQGSYTFLLTVKNTSGNTATDQVTVTVNPAAAVVPVANAGPNVTITLPTNSASLDGSASSSPDGSALTYAWALVSGAAGYTITSPSAAKTGVTGLVQGVYKFQLTVKNSSGSASTATVTVQVNAAAVVNPVADAGSDLSITLPTNSVSLDGSGSSSPDGSALTYAWTLVSGAGGYTIGSPAAAKTSVTGLVEGSYVFQLKVTNSQGNTASATVTVTVNPAAAADVPPVANAGNDTTITLPTNSIQLNGTKSYDPDGSIVSYNWFMSAGASGVTIVNANTATPTIVGLPSAGTYIFTLTVIDNSGLTGSASVTVTLNPGSGTGNPGGGSSSLVADAGSDTSVALPAGSLVLDGSRSTDVGGTITTYSWAQLSGPGTAVLTSAGSAVCPVSGLVTGQYVFQLTVTDDKGNTAKDTVIVSAVFTDRSADNNNLDIFPNPAQDVVNMKITSGNNGPMQINIVSSSGTLVQSIQSDKKLTSESRTLNVGSLSRGVYVVQVLIGDGQTRIVKKLVKQ